MTYRMARLVCVLAMSGIPSLLIAQGPATREVAGNQVSAQAQILGPEQLDDLVAPLALYPIPS